MNAFNRIGLTMVVTLLVSTALSAAFAWEDIAMFFGGMNTPFQLCFGVQSIQDTPTDDGYPTWAQVIRTRQESATTETLAFPRTVWTATQNQPQGIIYRQTVERFCEARVVVER
jgi:hypothetical protein